MFYPRTERQEQFLAVADDLAGRFAARAGEQDRSGHFPLENFAEIRAAGLPALVVPEAYGGWGATLPDTVMTMARLAVGDGSTALSLTMHMQTLGSAEEAGDWPPTLFDALCCAVVERGALVNSAATEPELGSPSRGGKPRTTAAPVWDDSGVIKAWTIDGLKSFASMFPALDYLVIPATLQDGTEDVGRFLVPCGAGADGAITVVRPWAAMGMRTTGSHDIRLTDVRVPAGNLIQRTSQSTGGKTNAWFMLTISAVYTGVAAAALRAAAKYAQERVPTALGRPIATLESIQRHLGQAELLIHQAELHLFRAAELWDAHPAQRATGAARGGGQGDGDEQRRGGRGSLHARGRRPGHDSPASSGALLPRRARRSQPSDRRRRGPPLVRPAGVGESLKYDKCRLCGGILSLH